MHEPGTTPPRPLRPAPDSEVMVMSLSQPEAFAAIFDRHFTAGAPLPCAARGRGLYAFASLSYEEIAASLAIPVGTVRSRLSRARAHLRVALTAPGAAAPSHCTRRTDDR